MMAVLDHIDGPSIHFTFLCYGLLQNTSVFFLPSKRQKSEIICYFLTADSEIIFPAARVIW